jgi:cytochrome c556
MKSLPLWRRLAVATATCAACLAPYAQAQQAPAPATATAPSAAEQAIAYRKAVFTVLAGNFAPVSAVLQGRAALSPEVLKRAERTAFLATLVPDAFPAISASGNTRAKAEVWSQPDAFDKASRDLIDASASLLTVLRKDNADTAAFRDAVTRIGQTCKSCHNDFRTK